VLPIPIATTEELSAIFGIELADLPSTAGSRDEGQQAGVLEREITPGFSP
jgi:hypothetical protein